MELSLSLQLTALMSYLLGAIPFGLVLSWAAGSGDIRKIGSGNIGATNVLRTGNKGLALATLLLDGGKGAIAVLVAGMISPDAALIAALFSVIGHNFPIWLKLKGGKGVATTLGVMFALSWPVGLGACLVWLATAVIFRYSSLAALVALASSPFIGYFVAGERVATILALLALLGIVRHHENIRRLRAGEESKIGKKSKPVDEKSGGEKTDEDTEPS